MILLLDKLFPGLDAERTPVATSRLRPDLRSEYSPFLSINMRLQDLRACADERRYCHLPLIGTEHELGYLTGREQEDSPKFTNGLPSFLISKPHQHALEIK